MPNFSGKWNLDGQLQGIKQGDWTGILQELLFSFGAGTGGALGTGDLIARSEPTQVGASEGWDKVTTQPGGRSCFAIKTDGTLWAWGTNDNGIFGNSDTINTSSPVQVGALTNWDKVQVGGNHCIALKTDGTLWCWGDGLYGQTGHNDTLDRSSPVQVGALTTWTDVAASASGSVAVNTGGEIYSWGRGSQGRLGQGDVVDRSSPTQIGALTNWSSTRGAYLSFIALKTDGTLWGWGNNGGGKLGHNLSRGSESSPVQVGALTTWADIDAGIRHSGAVKTDGTLWMWGDNGAGQLGFVTPRTEFSSPVQVGSLTNWSKIRCGAYHSLGQLTSGELYAWGQGTTGRLGDGNAVARSSPVQVGTRTDWNDFDGGVQNSVVSVSSRTGMS